MAVAVLMTVLMTALVGQVVVAPDVDAQTTPGLAEARAKANEITLQLDELRDELAVLDGDVLRLAEAADAASESLDGLRDRVREVALERYMGVGNETMFIPGADINAQARADVLVGIITRTDTDAIDEYRAVKAGLDRTSAELAGRKAEQRERLAELEARQQELYTELGRLEALEAERVEAQRRAAEQEARRAADEEARQQARAQADQLAARQQAARDGRAAGSGSVSAPPSTTPSPPIASGPFVCPVQGAVSFVNSWGFGRASGNRHQGVDMMSPRGTPVVIPVGGTVKTKTGGIGGLQFHLNGDDGNFYYGAHMDSFSGAQGHLPAGTVVGYVGDTGDAKGTGTHLHFEIHPGGWPNAINPYETVSRYC